MILCVLIGKRYKASRFCGTSIRMGSEKSEIKITAKHACIDKSKGKAMSKNGSSNHRIKPVSFGTTWNVAYKSNHGNHKCHRNAG